MSMESIHKQLKEIRAELATLSAVAGEWIDTPSVSGEYWVIHKFSYCRTYSIPSTVRVSVCQGEVECRQIGDDKWISLKEFVRGSREVLFSGPIPPPPTPDEIHPKRGRKSTKGKEASR